jgi:ribose transport system permease protein
MPFLRTLLKFQENWLLLVILGLDQNYSQIIIGSVVIAAVVLDNFNTWPTKCRLTQAH